MLKPLIKKLLNVANNKDSDSFVTKLRKKRFQLLNNLLTDLDSNKIKLLDIGGTPDYWKQVYDIDKNPLNLEITILNLDIPEEKNPFFTYIKGDAKNLDFIKDKEFDVCFSNSLIEHLGDLSQQMLSVKEMKRVSKKIYLQTPNLFFPIEPHYQVIFIHWLPFPIFMKLLSFFYKEKVENTYNTFTQNPITLLSKQELSFMFEKENFDIHKEKILFFTKSLIAISKNKV